MKAPCEFRRPVLAKQARYRWDRIRQQHQLVFPEGILVLNDSAAAIVQLCDGRPTDELIAAIASQFAESDPGDDVVELLQRLAMKGLLRDAADS